MDNDKGNDLAKRANKADANPKIVALVRQDLTTHRYHWSDVQATRQHRLMLLPPGIETFTVPDLYRLTGHIAEAWQSAVTLDWTVQAGTLEWSCTYTADHAIDCVYAPAFFLASRRTDAYPAAGSNLTLGPAATPDQLIESLGIATHILAAVVNDAEPETQAVIFHRPAVLTGRPPDFVPRAALELALHAHDVCQGLDVPFEPAEDLCHRLREHTFSWPMWTSAWSGLRRTNDPVDRPARSLRPQPMTKSSRSATTPQRASRKP